jgi:hypothetical protein
MTEVIDAPVVQRIDELTRLYIELRDQKKQLKAKYDEDVESIDAALARMEAVFMNQMNAQGLESMPNSAGTPYKQHVQSATSGDWPTFLKWVIENQAWHFLEKRVSKDAVKAYKEDHNEIPPGVNWRESVVVNVRRNS